MKKFFQLNTTFLLGIIVLHIIALLVKDIPILEFLALAGIGLSVLYITYRSLAYGVIITATEIFIGGHGHLIGTDIAGFPISLRITLFLAVMGGWLLLLATKKISLKFSFKEHYPFVILAAALVLGICTAVVRGNPFGFIFDDVNGYMTLALLLPVLSISWDNKQKKLLLQSLITSAFWLSIGTIILSYCFTHFSETITRPLYVFIRDTRLAEITLQSISDSSGLVTQPLAARFFGESGYWYRIFMQSQLFVAVAWLLLVSFILTTKEKITDFFYNTSLLVLFSAALFLSQSRSFFLSIAVAVVGVLAVALYIQRKNIADILKRIAQLALCGIVSLILVWLTVVFPLPKNPPLSDALFYSTSVDTTRDLAVTSRWSLLRMMHETIGEAPVLGSGFGTTITYVSDDPTVRDVNNEGLLETYRFEWGYHDIWIKMGLLGLVAYALYLFSTARMLWLSWKVLEQSWIILGLSASLIMLFITHIFSPYLNHPIGIILILLVLPFIISRTKQPTSTSVL